MAYIEIPKDLSKIKSTVILGLTMRQIIGFAFAGITAIPAFLICRQYLINDVAMLVLMIVAFPTLFITFYENDGLKAEQYLKYIFLYKFYHPKIRIKEKFMDQFYEDDN